MTPRSLLLCGALLGAIGVAAGAFGAHALQGRLSPDRLAVFETGVRYQLIHALALLATAWAVDRWPSPPSRAAGWLFLVGILLFSGSLYVLCLTGVGWLGAVTPLGGTALILGWLALAWAGWRAR